MTGAIRQVTLAALGVLLLVTLTGPTGHASDAVSPTTPIDHLVVMTQDGHSFDNYLGRRHGVDGLPAGVCLPVKAGEATPCVRPFPIATSGLHPRLTATAATQLSSVADGRMDGFVLAQATAHTRGTAALGYYRRSDVPVLSQLADQSVVFDRWFSAVPGGGIANQVYAVSGTVLPDTPMVPAKGWSDRPVIFDRLQAAGVSWKVYVEHYEPALTGTTAGPAALRGGQVARVPLLALARYERDPALMSHITDLDSYYQDLASGSLPAVSWIVTTTSTERPPADPAVAQRMVGNLVNALGESSAWHRSAFLLTYASSGGWYDHVVPPTRNGSVLGLRVPTLVISPYATAGRVDHTELDSAAVLRFIETNWRLDPLTPRDGGSPGLASAFAFHRPPHPMTIVGTAAQRPPTGDPTRSVLVVGYLLALLVAAAGVAWAARGGPRVALSSLFRDPA